jgi:very-short-patch-repair endonuclease
MPRMTKRVYAGKPMVERARLLRKEQTPQEAALWKMLRAGGFKGFHFRRQHQLGRYIADFYCADLKLVLELDGAQHQRSADQAYDQERDRTIRSLGLSVLRFPNAASHLEILDALETHLKSKP